MGTSLIIPTFIAGLLTFLAPCTLPLVPGYLGFISGVSLNKITNTNSEKDLRGKIFFNGLWYVLGFSLVFVVLGALAGLVGNLAGTFRPLLSRLGGVIVILFGLFMLNGSRFPGLAFLTRERRWVLPHALRPGNPLSSLIFGATFAFGWTPCIGPILATVLLLASTKTTVAAGAGLLGVFSLGLAIPFLLVALAVDVAAKYLRQVGRYLHLISFVGGIFLIFLGILLLTNSFNLWISFFYRLFGFLRYERLLNYF